MPLPEHACREINSKVSVYFESNFPISLENSEKDTSNYNAAARNVDEIAAQKELLGIQSTCSAL